MVISWERDGCWGGKLDLVQIFLGCIEDSALWFLWVFLVLFLVFSFFGWFRGFKRVFPRISLRETWVDASCIFVDDLVSSNSGKPLWFEGYWLELFVLGWVRVIRDSHRYREWEAKSFGALLHLVTHIISPKSSLKCLSHLGDPVTTLGRCSCEFAFFYAVHPRTVCELFPDSSRLADSPQGARGPFGGPFTHKRVLRLETSFVLWTVRACLQDSSPPPCRTVCGS
jgi:hypothetical protein